MDEIWETVATEGGLDRVVLMAQHPAIQLRLLRRLIGDVRIRADPLEAVIAGSLRNSGQLDLGYGYCLVCVDGVLGVKKP